MLSVLKLHESVFVHYLHLEAHWEEQFAFSVMRMVDFMMRKIVQWIEKRMETPLRC